MEIAKTAGVYAASPIVRAQSRGASLSRRARRKAGERPRVSQRFKKEYGPGTWVCGYADDMISYIPSRRVWDEGGYEGGSNLYEYGRPALRWAGDIEDRIAASVHKLVNQVRE